MVHGVLHLLGYDHMNDEDFDEMAAAEHKLLTRLGWKGDGLINSARAEAEADNEP
jgi:ssRNA-specific RNase YbeY (16S rRNA maturation enzyme)